MASDSVAQRIGLPMNLAPKVPIGNAENYRTRRSQPEDFSKPPVRSETGVISAAVVSKFPLEYHFI